MISQKLAKINHIDSHYAVRLRISHDYMQWREGSAVCHFYGTVGANASCYDEVDFSLCFEDTAILYGICTTFWVLAGFSFFRGNGFKPGLDFGVLHAIKLVSNFIINLRSIINT